jgi:LmbE family N-acetylglucosaminyl deacetylase
VKHIYLSPHLDDAVLSCGGAIHQQVSAGEPVLVVTLFTEDARPGASLSGFALDLHRQWGNVSRPMALRRAEDLATLSLLGAEGLHLDYLDAVYRAGTDGEWLYLDSRALFARVSPADPAQPAAIADRLSRLLHFDDGAVFYSPLAVGQHVDHQITHDVAKTLQERGLLPQDCRLAFYEDYPYAEQPGAIEAALEAVSIPHPERRGESPGAVGGHLRLEAIPLTPADVAAKVSALGHYVSQMAMLFDGVSAMPNRVWLFAATRSPDACLAERIWWPA